MIRPAWRCEIERIARDVTAVHADAADRDARFPIETIDALREAGLLSLLVPESLGGPGGDVGEVAQIIGLLGGQDGSIGVTLCMHYSQIAVLARHSETDALRSFLTRVHDEQLLLANSNSEIGVKGSERLSTCFIHETAGGRFELSKQTPVISYGEHADAILVTARRVEDSPANDQVVAVCLREDLDLEPTGPWDALGLRGSCSRPFRLRATGSMDMIVGDYARVVNETGLPVTDVMFGEYWLGMAEAAAATAHGHLRKKYRNNPDDAQIPLLRLAELVASLDQLRGLVRAATRRHAEIDGTEDVASLAFVNQLHTLKVAGTRLLQQIALESLAICGVAGYRNDSSVSLGRLVRDALGAGLMVNTDAVLAQNGQIMRVRKQL